MGGRLTSCEPSAVTQTQTVVSTRFGLLSRSAEKSLKPCLRQVSERPRKGPFLFSSHRAGQETPDEMRLADSANYKNKTAMIRIATGRNPIQITMRANMTSFWSSSAMEGKRGKAYFQFVEADVA
jgi:hypothetical protein